MKHRNLWPELIISALLLSIAWGLLKLTSIPMAVSDLYKEFPIPPVLPSMISSYKVRTPTSTATPTETALPAPGMLYMKLAVEDISNPEAFAGEIVTEKIVPASLILIVKETRTSPNGVINTSYGSKVLCVEMAAFLDANNVRMEKYDKQATKSVLFALDIKDLAPYGEALPAKEKIYLVPDPACEGSLTSPAPFTFTPQNPAATITVTPAP